MLVKIIYLCCNKAEYGVKRRNKEEGTERINIHRKKGQRVCHTKEFLKDNYKLIRFTLKYFLPIDSGTDNDS
jgi:hypothetical protein